MAFDPVKNGAYGTVATGGAPSPATSGASLTLATGDGARFPQPSTDGAFYVVLWPSGSGLPLFFAGATPVNAEIARCTARAADVLTLTRGQAGTTAQAVADGWQVSAAITAEMLQAMQTSMVLATLLTTKGDLIAASAASTPARLGIGATNGQVLQVDSAQTLGMKWAAVPFHGAKVNKASTNQVIASGAGANIAWDGTDWDTDAFWSSGSNTRLTVPAGLAGKYAVHGTASFDNGATFDQMLEILVNAVEIHSTRDRNNAPECWLQTYTELNLAVGDFVQLSYYQGSGSNKTTAAAACEFSIRKVG